MLYAWLPSRALMCSLWKCIRWSCQGAVDFRLSHTSTARVTFWNKINSLQMNICNEESCKKGTFCMNFVGWHCWPKCCGSADLVEATILTMLLHLLSYNFVPQQRYNMVCSQSKGSGPFKNPSYMNTGAQGKVSLQFQQWINLFTKYQFFLFPRRKVLLDTSCTIVFIGIYLILLRPGWAVVHGI